MESELGKGSTFYFSIPLGLPAEEEVLKTEEVEKREGLDIEEMQPLNILLVEDSEDIQLLIKTYIRKAPYQIEIAQNGKEGLEKYKSGKYDLIMMDVQMPIMDGLSATRKIREWEKKKEIKATPVIALTAHAIKEYQQECLDAGCNSFVVKPIKKKEFLRAIYEETKKS